MASQGERIRMTLPTGHIAFFSISSRICRSAIVKRGKLKSTYFEQRSPKGSLYLKLVENVVKL